MRRHSIGGPVTNQNALQIDPVSVDEAVESISSKSMVVAVRIRPLSNKEIESGHKACVSVVGGSNTIAIKKIGDPAGYLKSQLTSINEYGFDAVFDENSTQMQIYQATAKPFIPNLLAGLNVTVFAYGATGAGKTHTMLGNTRADEAAGRAEGGIIPNTVNDLFAQIESKRETASFGESWSLSATFVEIYNEQVYDLLEPTGKVLQLREDQEKGIVVVAGVAEQITSSAKVVFDLLQKGNQNRKTEATMANQVSSRSHAVLQLTLRHCRRNDSGRETVIESKLSLIDLAGSERASATNNRGVRLIEGANINKSLLALANCINALASNSGSNKRTNVKYRDSRLTHLLKSSLEGGNCNLIMIANINPSDQTFEDSHNTLKYANRAKNIKVDPRSSSIAVESTWVEREARLRDENSRLRERVTELEILVELLQQEVEAKNDPKISDYVNNNLEFNIEESNSKSALESGEFSFVELEMEPDTEAEIDADAGEVNKSTVLESSIETSIFIDLESTNINGSQSFSKKRKAEFEMEQICLSDIELAAGLEADASMMLVMTEVEEDENPITILPHPSNNKKRRGSLLPLPRSRNSQTAFENPSEVSATLAPVQPLTSIPSDRRTRRHSMGCTSGGTQLANDENANPQIRSAAPIATEKETQKGPVASAQGRRKSLAAVSALLDSSMITQHSDISRVTTRSGATAMQNITANVNLVSKPVCPQPRMATRRKSICGNLGVSAVVTSQDGWTPNHQHVYIDI